MMTESAAVETSGGLVFTVVNYGAALQSLIIPTANGPVNCVLGYVDASHYRTDPYYIGAMVGRYANRIRGGRLSIAGTDVQLDANEETTGNCLHGGSGGFHSKHWILEANEQKQCVSCSLHSLDGDQGFPGNLSVRVEYRALSDLALSVEVFAKTDAPTVVNLVHHPYFNLNSASDHIAEHWLCVLAESFTPVDETKIPTGEISDVAGTNFDFRELRQIEEFGLDHNFVLNSGSGNLVLAAELYSPQTRIRLRIRTTQPGLQVYTADFLDGDFAPREGIALEAQNFPDAPNQPGFPSALLLPGSEYRQQTVYEFEVD